MSGRLSSWALVAIVVVSALLRFGLCERGGQFFFGDELRYDRTVRLYFAISDGNLHDVRETLALPEHALFPWIGAIVMAAQHVLAQLTPYGDWSHHPEFAGFTMWIGACVLSLFSTLNVVLVQRLARVMGADPLEALWAALVMAASNTAFYYSRHLLPYDCALSFALAAMLVGLKSPSACRAMLCGLLAGCAYHAYNGYWFLPPVVALVFTGYWWGDARRWSLVSVFCAGMALGLGLPLLIGTLAGGAQYWRTMVAFSGTVTQGSFSEGWSLPWAYLWSSEDWLGIAVAACVLAALCVDWMKGHPIERRVRIWLAAAAAVYGFLVLGSVVLEKFVVYGRTVKPLVPLFCLLAGWALHRLVGDRRGLGWVCAGALAACAAIHFAPHFARVFPRDVEITVLREFGNPKRTLSMSGSIYIPLALPVTRADLALVNAQMIYPVRGFIGFPKGRTLLRIEHPLTYAPFQYEGHSPKERAMLRTQDISIRLIILSQPHQVPDDLPIPLRFQATDRSTAR